MKNFKLILLMLAQFLVFHSSTYAQSNGEIIDKDLKSDSNKRHLSNYHKSTMCPPDYLFGGNGGLTGTVNNTQIYETDGPIESTQTIGTNAIIEYDSKTIITLNSDFKTINGANFHAYIDGCDLQCEDLIYDGSSLAVNATYILDFGMNNNFSDNHYEYYLVISDGNYNGGNEYIGGTYTITIELLSLGNSFNYGDFPSCFFCGNEVNNSYVGHLFLIEDTNDDDLLDFNTDPFYNGDTGFVKISNGNLTEIEIDFTFDNGKILFGCYSGQFTIDP